MTHPEHTPEVIAGLPEKAIFVFGSNPHGNHGGGAAKTARLKFGAKSGVGRGPMGQSYAIPTTAGLELFADEARRFIKHAVEHPELTFYLTRVGCGISGYTDDQVSHLFASAPSNVLKPEGW